MSGARARATTNDARACGARNDCTEAPPCAIVTVPTGAMDHGTLSSSVSKWSPWPVGEKRRGAFKPGQSARYAVRAANDRRG